MQIFVKVRGRTLTIDVEPDTLITDLQAAVAQKLSTATETVAPDGIALGNTSGRKLTPGHDKTATVGDYNVQKEQTLLADVIGSMTTTTKVSGSPTPTPSITTSTSTISTSTMSTYFPHLKDALAHDLLALADQPKVLVFIGIASYDNGHPQGDASIRRQQCPAHLFDICAYAGLTPHILLVDQGFATIGGPPQIYDIDPGWSAVPSSPSGPSGPDVKEVKEVKEDRSEKPEENKIRSTFVLRRFRHTNGAQLCLYPTYVDGPEYHLLNSTPKEAAKLGTDRTLAGLDLYKIAAAVAKNGGVLVAGNFFGGAVPYCLGGPDKVLAQLGAPYYLC